jgi:hypothetical protein
MYTVRCERRLRSQGRICLHLTIVRPFKYTADDGRQLRAGAKITFPKYERYFPQISEADAYQTVSQWKYGSHKIALTIFSSLKLRVTRRKVVKEQVSVQKYIFWRF